MRGAILIVMLALTSSCTPRPNAKLEFVSFEFDPHHYDVIFDSDIRIESIYPEDYWRSPSLPKLICSKDKEPKFDVENEEMNVARGDIDFEAAYKAGSRYRYRYRAHLLFSHPSALSSNESPSQQQLIDEWGKVHSIVCKVRISHYVGPAYFSDAMPLPKRVDRNQSRNTTFIYNVKR